MKRSQICCFSGYRPSKLPWGSVETDERCQAFQTRLYREILQAYHEGKRRFMCGMAQGSDLLFCQAALDVRNTYPELEVEAVLPCMAQSERWSEWDRERYDFLIRQCDTVTICQQNYDQQCMQRRNQYMVDSASLVIAGYDGRAGGTHNTVTYAQQSGVPVKIILLPR